MTRRNNTLRKLLEEDDDDPGYDPGDRVFLDFDPSENDLATRLIDKAAGRLRYCPDLASWLTWDRRRWVPDPDGAQHWFTQALSGMRNCATGNDEPDRDTELIKFDRRSIRHSAIALARTRQDVQLSAEKLDADPMRLNCANGTLDLRTGELGLRRRSDYCTRFAPVSWEDDATCPVWRAFLDRAFAWDTELTRYVQKAIGYTLTGSVSEQVIFLLWGSGANGKTTLLNTLLALLGGYARTVDSSLLTAGARERHTVDSMELFRTRLVVLPEAPEARQLSESKLKALTGGDRVLVKRPRQEAWEFAPSHKMWVATNQLPKIRGTDDAIWRRLRPIPFAVQIADGERDKALPEKLQKELPGILRWAVEGCLAWQQEGLQPPEQIIAATEEYRRDQDVVATFIEECCVVGPDKQATPSELFAALRKWTEESGQMPIEKTVLGMRFAQMGFTAGKGGRNSHRVWKGIGLPSQAADRADLDDVAIQSAEAKTA